MLIVKKGFHYSQDGPGNRLIYHLQGCNMHCPWCSNPEAMATKGTWMKESQGRSHLSCTAYSVTELLQEAEDAKYLFFDNGGITFSGGEPTLQFEELLSTLKGLRRLGISAVMETNATHPRLQELFPYLDVLITDFKHPNDECHRQVTGISNQQIRRNIQLASEYHMPLWIRTPVIRDFNADIALIPQFLAFYRTLDNTCTQYELLPYHEYGKAKWEKCGMPYTIEDGHVTPELISAFEEAYRFAGLKVVHT